MSSFKAKLPLLPPLRDVRQSVPATPNAASCPRERPSTAFSAQQSAKKSTLGSLLLAFRQLSTLEHIRSQDEIITDLRAALARADDAATADRTDRKAILGALDVLASSVREVKAAVQTPANRSTANGVPSAASFEFQPKRPTLAEIAARDPPAVSPPQAPAPGFGRPTPATEALARAIQPPRPSPAALLRNAVRAPPRSLLGPQDFALIHIRNLRRMAPSAVRSMCAALGVDVAHIHDVGRVGPVTELVVTKNRRDEIASQLSVSPVADAPELALQLDLAFDASKPVLPNANAELAERVRADFNARMREQQGRCAGFGWTGLADFFAGRVSTAASRRAGQTTTPAKNDDQTAQARNTATHAAALPSSASADASSAMEGVEGDAAGTVLPAAAATASAPSVSSSTPQ
ncbi:hypothetical protein OC842_000842 [Tilletia horrida]|uniref:Uncharacterized protein n=1 Tax=Tilletia horrida TaxID=155126 RepID=A0AAN6GIM0_9BASI|nr:hypothetical protein OC842_000842 [Tilletia horrida]